MKYKVLERFTPEARADAAAHVYDQRRQGNYVCADGLCVLARLVRFDYPERWREVANESATPEPFQVAAILGLLDGGTIAGRDEYREIIALVESNDKGRLATPEAVAALFAEV